MFEFSIWMNAQSLEVLKLFEIVEVQIIMEGRVYNVLDREQNID